MDKRAPMNLDTLLAQRAAPPHREDFVRHIVSAAAMRPQRRTTSLSEWLSRLFADFHLPQPAWALAGVLMLGLLVGLGTARDSQASDTTYLQDITTTDEGAAL